MDKPTIGILAGMGPRSTSPFLEKVLDQCQRQLGATHDIDFPPIMIYSLPTPFYVDQPIDHEAMQHTIQAGLQRLEQTGVNFIAMPCNSAHQYYTKLQAAIAVPLLNMIEIATQELPGDGKTVAILGTQTTVDSKLYEHRIQRKGLTPFHDASVQQHVNQILEDIKLRNDQRSATSHWSELSDYLKSNQVDSILVACTDLQAIINGATSDLPILDAADCLARQAVIRWQQICQQ